MSGRASYAVALVETILADPEAVALLRAALAEGQPAHDEPVAYTVAALAAATGLSEPAIRGAIRRRELSAIRRGGGASGPFLIPRSAVEKWLSQLAEPRDRGRVRLTPRLGTSRSAGPLAAALAELRHPATSND